MTAGYEGLALYYGDLHNHCDVSYGHGSLEDAFHNARLQLDFVSVTAHAHWPDLPEADSRLAAVNAYHREGFQRAIERWPAYRELTNAVNDDGAFVSFLSFEWHSLLSGDHNIYYRGDRGEIIPAASLEDMREHLRALSAEGVETLLIPHHIGYRRGYRGIDWSQFTPEFSPFVEICSMHGVSESDTAPFPYLHTMGPRDTRSTMQHGLARGNVVGMIGSTDHHAAHPGSYGHGRIGAWANELSRDGLWDALTSRRVYALTGDAIDLMFSLNGRPMGSVVETADTREIAIAVSAGDAIDMVELLHNNRVVQRWDGAAATGDPSPDAVKILLELGWGEERDEVEWQVDLEVTGGKIAGIEPRFRGRDIVSPQDTVEASWAFTTIDRSTDHTLQFRTRSWRNPTVTTPAMQGISLDLQGNADTRITGTINGQKVTLSLGDLLASSSVGYLGGFLTPAWCFHRAVPLSACRLEASYRHDAHSDRRDWYYVRVRQRNNQWAWSSPIWVEPA